MAEASPVRQVKVWDGWIRLVHWAIVLLIGHVVVVHAGRASAEVHYLSGYARADPGAVPPRLGRGRLATPRASRASCARRSPRCGISGSFGRREPDTEIGHNAAGGWMVLVLLGLLLAQALTGLFANESRASTTRRMGPWRCLSATPPATG